MSYNELILIICVSIVLPISYSYIRNIEYKKINWKDIFLYIFIPILLSIVFLQKFTIITIPIILIIVDIRINKPSKQLAIYSAIFITVNYFVSDSIINTLLKIIFNKDLNMIQYILYEVLSSILALIISKIIGNILKERKIKNRLNIMLINIIVSFTIISITFVTYKRLNIDDVRLYIINFILFSSYIISNGIMNYYYNKVFAKELELKNKEEEIASLNEYTSNIERLYDNLRKFKHDYKNILITLNGYIEEKEYDNLEKYFKENILNTGKLVDTNDFKIKLKNIKDIPLKSLFIVMSAKAEDEGINIRFDIEEEISYLPIRYVDLGRVLGILIDNAIEEAINTKDKIMNIGIIVKGNSTVIVIQNSCRDSDIPLMKLRKSGFSTKGENRGLGLHNAVEILAKYSNATLNMERENNIFTVEVWLRR